MHSQYRAALTIIAGICAGTSDRLSCQATTSATTESLRSELGVGSESILSFALALQSKIFLYLPAVAGALFFLGLVFFALLKRHLKAPPNVNAKRRRLMFKRYTLGLLWAAVGFALASIIALSQATSALKVFAEAAAGTAIDVVPGLTLQILQWMSLACMFLFAVAVADMLKSIGGGRSTGRTKDPMADIDMSGPPPPPPFLPPP